MATEMISANWPFFPECRNSRFASSARPSRGIRCKPRSKASKKKFPRSNAMSSGTHANLTRTCEVIEIPSGTVSTLAQGTPVRIMQSRGDSYTVWTDYGQMYRIDGKDADAIGQQPPTEKASAPEDTREFNEQMVWDIL